MTKDQTDKGEHLMSLVTWQIICYYKKTGACVCSHLLQLVSGGGDKYAPLPYGEQSACKA